MSTSTILSDNGVSSGTSGIKTSGGNDGTLVLQTTTAGGAATTAVTIDTSQNTTLAGTLTHPLGSAGSPSITFTGDTNTGLYSSGADTVVVVTGGTAAQTIDSGQRTKFPTTIAVGAATPSTSGSGITFPATQSASTNANTLDDYEEGTWTPVYTGSTGSIGSTAYSSTGTYTKIGNVVTIGMRLVLTNKGSWTGAVVITGLPFTSANDSIQNMGALWTANVTFVDQINARIGPNEATIVPRINTSAAGGDYLQTTAVTNSSEFYCTITYRV